MYELNASQENRSKKKLVILVFLVLIIAVAGIAGWLYKNHNVSPIPKNVRQSVNFPIYYPDQKKLPFDYTFNLKSFTNPKPNILLYAVDYGVDKKIVFSLQTKPSNDEIQKFYAFTLPLTFQVNTAVGQARIGLVGEVPNRKTLVSLPTNDGVWIIGTAPDNINQDQLNQVVKSLRK